MFNVFKLSGQDWKNLDGSGWLIAGFVFFICWSGLYQENGNWLLSLAWAVPLFIGVTFMTMTVVAVWALPFIIWEFFEDRADAWRRTHNRRLR